jgi:transposase-like protein
MGSSASLTSFVRESVQKGGVVVSDGLQSYRSLPEHGYHHKRRIVEGSTKDASTLLPRVHRVASLLKRWLLGTHQGAVSREHLDYYLDEFTFRFNRRTSQHRGKLFYRLVQQAVAVSPAPYDAIIKHVRSRRSRTHKPRGYSSEGNTLLLDTAARSVCVPDLADRGRRARASS